MSDAKLEVTGVLYKDFGTQRVTDKMEKREFVIETTDEQYPQLIKFELINDKCKLLDDATSGDKMTIYFNLRGREWKKDATSEPAYFNSLTAWRIEKVGGETSTAKQEKPKTAKTETNKATTTKTPAQDGGDDLPF